MSIKVGDKFIIEIGTIAELPDGKKKYFIKPFESLVFDRKGLEQLEKCDKAWEDELEKAKLFAYKDGFETGKLWAIKENAENYNTAINDYSTMIQWLHDCTDDFKEFMNKKYGYDIMYLTNPKVDEGVMLYDLMCDHDIAEVISEFKKWKEEKKKAEEVENYHILVDTLRTVTEEYSKETIVSALSEFGFEVDKLRGKE